MSQSASNPEQSSEIDAAVAAWYLAAEREERPDRVAFLQQYPHLATELQEFLADFDEFQRLAVSGTVSQSAVETSRTGAGNSQPGNADAETSIPRNFGRYQIEKELGKGAMGVVYLAEDTQLRRKVALKIPAKSSLNDPQTLERFYREAQTSATLRHPNICPVFDVGSIDGTHYLTMAYIPGKPVSAFLTKNKLPAARQVALLIRKIALAIEEAHQHGIVHRDLKPSNVMLDQRNEPIVMDFGLARQTNNVENARLTQSGAILGTPAYMAPEQVEGEIDQVGPQSDIYALGVMLYQFLTGDLPFQGPILSVFAQILRDEPKRPRDVRAGVPAALEAICLKMMAKQPAQRYASMKEAAAALTEFIKQSSMAEPAPVMPKASKVADVERDVEEETLLSFPDDAIGGRKAKATARNKPSAVRRNFKLWIAAGTSVLALTMLFAIVVWMQNGKVVVKVTIDDPTASVKIDGQQLQINSEGIGEIRLTLQEHTYTVQRNDEQMESPQTFTIMKNGSRLLDLRRKPANPKIDVVEDRSQPSTFPAKKATTSELLKRLLAMGFTLVDLRSTNKFAQVTSESTIPENADQYQVFRLWVAGSYTIPLEKLSILKELPQLEHLVFRNGFQPAGTAKYVPPSSRLSNLELACINDAEVDALPELPNLTYLRGSDARGLTAKGLQHLAKYKRLGVLHLDVASFTEADLRDFPEFPELLQLWSILDRYSKESGERMARVCPNLHTIWINVYDTSNALDFVEQLPRLTNLVIYGDGFSDGDVDRIAKLTGLKTLSLYSSQLTPVGLARLKAALPQCEVTVRPAVPAAKVDYGLHREAAELFLAQKMTINIIKQDGFQYSVDKLEDLPNYDFPLVTLATDSAPAPISREGWKLLHQINLQFLQLGAHPLSDDDWADLANYRALEGLQFNGTPLTETRLSSLVNLKRLTQIGFKMTGIKGPWLKVLQDLPLLHTVHLWEAARTDEDAQYLAGLPISGLYLYDPGFTDRGIDALETCPKLTLLNISGDTKISETRLKKFAADHPGCEILYGPEANPKYLNRKEMNSNSPPPDPEPVGEVRQFQGFRPGAWITRAIFSPDGKRVLANCELIREWDMATGKEISTYGDNVFGWGLDISNDGKFVVNCPGNHDFILRSRPSGEELARWPAKQGPNGSGCRFEPGSQRVLLWGSEGIFLWDRGKLVRSFESPVPAHRAAFSPNGEFVIAAGADRRIRVWNLKDEKPLYILEGHSDNVLDAVFTPDLKSVVSASADNSVRVWDVASRTELRRMERHAGVVWAVAVSSDGKRIFSGGDDRTARLWDLSTGAELAVFNANPLSTFHPRVCDVQFSPNGKYGLSCAFDGSVRLWRLPPDKKQPDDSGEQPTLNPPLVKVKQPLAFVTLGFDQWVTEAAALPADQQVKAVVQKLQELNPHFKGTEIHQTQSGVVTEFNCCVDHVTDISPLRAFTELKSLTLRGSGEGQSKFSDLSPLKDMQLTHLELCWTEIADLLPLRGMPLTELFCGHCPVSDLSPLEGMKLTSLDCRHTAVSDLAPLNGMKLNSLDCRGTPVSTLSPLAGMPLTELICWNTEVADLLPLKDMPLKILEVGGTNVSDLSLLKGMRLTKFGCWRTGVTDLAPLKGMPLELLWFDHTQISDLLPLKGMPLTQLSLYATEVSDLSPLQGMKLIEVWFTPKNITKGLSVLRSMKSLEIIGITWSDHEKWPHGEFWKRYDAGEFGKPVK